MGMGGDRHLLNFGPSCKREKNGVSGGFLEGSVSTKDFGGHSVNKLRL